MYNFRQMKFDWDDDKAAINISKHNIAFDLAALVFLDENRLTACDNRFGYGEERMITMGQIDNRLHVIVYTEREGVIRIISARKANKREQERYGNG